MEATTDDRRAEFLVLLGQCCDAARLAGLAVRVELEDGSTVEGVPTDDAEPRMAAEEVDHSGTRTWLELQHTVVMTSRVRSFCVGSPG